MHKLAKGLKKKKKQKKGKKGEDDEEFDPEELERYRRERAEAQQKLEAEAAAAAEAASTEGDKSSTKPKTENDEWKKFQALTSGIDTVLKKTQDDLDRIKSTSFYQRKEKEPEPDPEELPEVQARKQELAKRYAGFDEHGNPIELKDGEEQKEESGKARPLPVTEDGIVEVPDDDDEHEDSADEDIFDTAYVDVIQNVEVQLAYIPDSPTQEELGDDPFDTSSADKVLKIVDTKTGRKLVSLGNAAEVLSGRVDHVSSCKIGRNRPRQTQDLLLADFDAEVPIVQVDEAAVVESEPIEIEKTLLDDDSDLPEADLPPVDLTKLPPIIPSRPITPANPDENDLTKPLDISEFELLKDKTLLDEIPVLDDEEFDLNAPDEPAIVLEEPEDPFAEKAPEVALIQEEIVEIAFEAATFINEDDPFDTTIADNLLPGKTELKFIEKELDEIPKVASSSDVSIAITDPRGLSRNYESEAAALITDSAIKKDLLGGSSTDLSQLADKPIQPVEELTYVDPFDTSNIQELPPGQTELKVLEQELLGQNNNHIGRVDDLDDDDFDPRADEPTPPIQQKPVRPPPITQIVQDTPTVADFEEQARAAPRGRKPSRPEALEIAPKVVAFELPAQSNRTDLLAAGEEEKSLPGKPLTPYYPQKSIEETLPSELDEQDEAAVDPFDTSFVPNTAPGKTELKIIESELLNGSEQGLTHSLSEHDLESTARAVGELEAPSNRGRRQSDFGPGGRKPQPPPVKSSEQVIESLINRRKALEKRQDSILDTAVEVAAEPLAPNVKPSTIEEEIELTYKDPFDTSHATNILPGKAELKLLEDELSQVPDPEPVKPHPVIEELAAKLAVEEDPDFDPRAGEEGKDILCSLDVQGEGEALADKVLTPIQDADLQTIEDIDPFDTSFASIGPGKTELKILESELISNQ